MKFHAVVIVLSVWASCQIAHGSSNRYQLIKGFFTWYEAELDSEKRGGHLVTITSQQEWNAIVSSLGNSLKEQLLWLGANNDNPSKEWTWVTGEKWEYTRWSEGEPSGIGGKGPENYLLTWGDGNQFWNDGTANDVRGYILEIEPLNPARPSGLSQPKFVANSAVELTFYGNIGQSYLLQFSTNLAEWFGVTNFVARLAGNRLTDLQTRNLTGLKFYRIRDARGLPLIPSIVVHPQSQIIAVGASITFVVTAIGNAPLTYEWRLNGVNIAGENQSTLRVNNAQATNAGRYTVAVMNPGGKVTSDTAILTVRPPEINAPKISVQPQNQTVSIGGNASFAVIASGSSPLSYQWLFDGTNLRGATSSTYTVNNAQSPSAGNYSVLVSNSAGSIMSQSATLAINSAAAISSSKYKIIEGLFTWDEAKVHAERAGGNLATITSSEEWDAIIAQLGGSLSKYHDQLWLGASNDNPGNVWTWVTDEAWDYTRWSPGEPSGMDGARRAEHYLQTWGFGNSLWNDGIGSNRRGYILELGLTNAPRVLVHPESQTVTAGASMSFNIGVSGSPPLYYQWRINGVNIPGATGSTYSISDAQSSNAGAYSVVVTNLSGSVTSNSALLTVNPAMTSPFAPASILGKSIRVGVTDGSEPFADSGSYRFVAASNGNSYIVIPLSFEIEASNGTYSYTKTGPTTAALQFADSVTGTATAHLTFITPIAGTFIITAPGTTGRQTGNFIIE